MICNRGASIAENLLILIDGFQSFSIGNPNVGTPGFRISHRQPQTGAVSSAKRHHPMLLLDNHFKRWRNLQTRFGDNALIEKAVTIGSDHLSEMPVLRPGGLDLKTLADISLQSAVDE
jgi:hypothetical protein